VISHVNTSAVLNKMSILKLFQSQSEALDDLPRELPDPNGQLSKTVPPLAIKIANDKAQKSR